MKAKFNSMQAETLFVLLYGYHQDRPAVGVDLKGNIRIGNNFFKSSRLTKIDDNA